MDKKLLLDIQLAQAIADYLQGRPWREVNSLINQLARLQPAPEPTPEEPAPKENTP